jgi:glutamate-1-semialdehyde 2,1-aminomutase
MAFGPLILGHAHEAVRAAAEAALGRGWSLGTAEPYSLELAEFIVERVPWVESIRFVNSGTEAVMSVLRVARAATGRDKILKFEGCYHGHTDSMLLRAGSGLAEAPVPDSAGLAREVVNETLVAPLDDLAAVQAVFEHSGREIAAVIIEPLPANYGLLPQRTEFLQAVAQLARSHGALLIFDEVISGFRLGFTGYAGVSGIRPDLVTYGKVIGGGFPVGAYAGRRDLMEQVAPAGPVYQAGTLSANPLAMCAGLAALKQLADGNVYRHLAALGERLERALAGTPGLALQRVGSIFWPVLSRTGTPALPIRSIRQFPADAGPTFAAAFHALLDRGIYLAPSAFEVGFLSAAHTEAHIDALAHALRSLAGQGATQ